MKAATATAPGKIILLGEHAVVYGRPAIAAPVWEATARVTVQDASPGSGCTIIAHDLNLTLRLTQHDSHALDKSEPLLFLLRMVLAELDMHEEPDWTIHIRSSIPIASGLGSGAAISVAFVRAVSKRLGRQIEDKVVSDLVYETEKLYHGSPSGIDNTVITYGLPVWFVKGRKPLMFKTDGSIMIVIGDSGVPAPTKKSVADVANAWRQARDRYDAIFDEVGEIVAQSKPAIETGNIVQLGRLFDRNQSLLEEIGVSSPILNRLILAARKAGAWGAKLSGGGRGGNMIALVDPRRRQNVEQSILSAGAKRTIVTDIGGRSVD